MVGDADGVHAVGGGGEAETGIETAHAAAVERVIALVREELPAQVKVLASDRGCLDLDLILGLHPAGWQQRTVQNLRQITAQGQA